MIRRRLVLPLVLVGLSAFLLSKPVTIVADMAGVSPSVETQPVPSAGDAADDAAIWVHPSDPSLSTIIGTDKDGGIAVYDLAGRQVQYLPVAEPNNVDLRYDFPLGARRVSLVVVSKKDGSLGVYAMNPTTRSLVDVAARPIRPGIKSYGLCLYQSSVNDQYYAFVTDESGAVEQWQLHDNGHGQVDGVKVRSLQIGSQTEGCVADDALGVLYAAEEAVGIWRYGAEPWDGAARRRVDSTGPGGHLTSDVEGLTLYHAANGAGYLIASSQGSDSFVVYERGDANAYVTTFEIVDGETVDGVSSTDGIDVVNLPLGSAFPEGLFVAQDGTNPDGKQNFKMVPWGRIARAVSPKLALDTSWDQRQAASARRANRPPSVSASPHVQTARGRSARLEGSASDDGRPDPLRKLATAWSQVDGPGVASFADPSATETSVSFSVPGRYALRLTADDGDLIEIDTVTVEVPDPNRPKSLVRAASVRGVRYQKASSSASPSRPARESPEITQMVGFRFTDLGIPRNAKILSAYLEFEAGEKQRVPSLTIRGQAADNPPVLTRPTRDASLWPLTLAGIDWFPGARLSVRGAVERVRTPDLASVLQEIVCRPGWAPGNAVVFVVTRTGDGAAFGGGETQAPLLFIDYRRRHG